MEYSLGNSFLKARFNTKMAAISTGSLACEQATGS